MSNIIKNHIFKGLILVAISGFAYFGGAAEIVECDGNEFDFIDSSELECGGGVCFHITYIGNNECEVRVVKNNNVEEGAKPINASMDVCDGSAMYEPICDNVVSQ